MILASTRSHELCQILGIKTLIDTVPALTDHDV